MSKKGIIGVTKESKKFINRTVEVKELEQLSKGAEPKIIIVYGRRRVGNTELIEKVFGNRRLMKFEGLEGADDQAQRKEFLRQLITLSKDLSLLTSSPSTWTKAFELLTPHQKANNTTLYFEELQW